MGGLKLKIGCYDYDRTHAPFDGTVTFDGVEGARIVSDIFENMVRHHAYDVSELGLTFYLRTLELEDPPFVAIPVFPNRFFRHSAIFINKASGIEEPEDLAGKTIGEFGIYGHDAGVWPKGILFSTDYPYRFEPDGGARRFLESADLDDAGRRKIAHENWERMCGAIRR